MAISLDTSALRDATVELLGRVGMKVEHDEPVAQGVPHEQAR